MPVKVLDRFWVSGLLRGRCMVKLVRFSWVLLAALVFGCGQRRQEEIWPEDGILEERAQEYFDERFRFYPVQATAAGLHTYDAELGRFAASQMRSRMMRLRDFRQRLLGIDLTKLSRSAFIDALLLTSAVKAEIFELEEIAAWRRSPRFYSEIICSGIWSLLEEESPPESRLLALLSRLDQIQPLLESVATNIERPPPILVQDGIADLRNCQKILMELPAALQGVADEELLAQIRRSGLEAQRSIEQFIVQLNTRVAPGAAGSFRLGEDKLRVRLLYGEMEETPLPRIRLLGERTLTETKESMKEIATAKDASLPRLLGEVSSQRFAYEQEDAILSTAEGLLQELRRFVLKRNVAGPVPDAPVPVVEGALFLPRQAAAMLHTPGPLAAGGWAVFKLALPSPLSPYSLQLLSMREVYPGKYLRFVSQTESPSAQSEVRRVLTSRANRDGWSHYVEQMLLDEGYGSSDPLLRLIQLHQALVEQCRLVTTILLHAEGMSLSRATQIFMNEAYLDAATAEREARAAACDTSRMSAALGKLQILKLRRDYFEAEGGTKTLRDFHEAFLSSGEPPLRLVRLLLLPDAEGQTLED